ncbi:MAG: hypothetical protein HOP11_10925, partial [Saprospiraceae bacterium]|nr:hypothetical protein [Saprospiraceae bacterium]
IEGQVLEYGSNKPLPFAKVVLRESIFPPFSGGGNYIPIDTFEVDVEGNSYTKFKIYPPSQLLFKATIPQTFVICSLAN